MLKISPLCESKTLKVPIGTYNKNLVDLSLKLWELDVFKGVTLLFYNYGFLGDLASNHCDILLDTKD